MLSRLATPCSPQFRFPKLQSLRLRKPVDSAEELSGLAQHRHLRELSLESQKKIRQAHLVGLTSVTSLTSLNLRGCSKVRQWPFPN
jgi:hypothetical protein